MKELILKNKAISILIALIIVAVIIWLVFGNSGSSTESAKLAKCLKDKGAKFYGASWCPHCQSQKKAFGDATKYLPYVECSNADRTQKQVCIDAGIKGYPTWIFPDGKIQSREMTIQQLKDAVGC